MNRPATRMIWAKLGHVFVLVCCLLSLLAGCDRGVLVLLLDPDLFTGEFVCVHEEQEPVEDEDGEMLFCRSVPESQREEQKQHRGATFISLEGISLWHGFHVSSLASQRSIGLPGGEHAFRNGVGVPLLC